uniref:Uncharacterized protein n=1 Tax=Knipowitschia caucasica TaxID=637954 RepID=A0AAV2LDA3_KNICA
MAPPLPGLPSEYAGGRRAPEWTDPQRLGAHTHSLRGDGGADGRRPGPRKTWDPWRYRLTVSSCGGLGIRASLSVGDVKETDALHDHMERTSSF